MTDGVLRITAREQETRTADRLGTHDFIVSLCAFLFDRRETMKKVGIVMGSDSDAPVIEKAVNVLKELKIPYEVHIYSAHRTPDKVREFSENAEERGIGVIIAAAGMAAHLAGVIAASTTLPVIGIPCRSKVLDGIDALLSTVQMPPGIPVATVAIDGGINAALLCAQILAISDTELSKRLKARREDEAKKVIEKNKDICEKF